MSIHDSNSFMASSEIVPGCECYRPINIHYKKKAVSNYYPQISIAETWT